MAGILSSRQGKDSPEMKLLASSHVAILGVDTWSSEFGHWADCAREKIMGGPNVYFISKTINC